MGWASVLKAGGKAAKWAGKGAVTVLETGGRAVMHPARTLKGAGAAAKTAAVGAGMGYVGWKKITTDESVVGIVSDALIGQEATEKIGDTIHNTVDGIRDLKESVGCMTEKVANAARNVDGKLDGISSFLSDVSQGNGGQMLGSFLGNLARGNVSGMGVMGLVLSSLLVFGRFGWMARLAGALLAMTTIGNNSRRDNSPAVTDRAGQAMAQEKTQRMQQEEPAEVEQIHRRR